MTPSLVIIIIALHIIVTFVGLFVTLHFQKKALIEFNPEELSNNGLIEVINNIFGITLREAIESAMLADGRDLFDNHIAMIIQPLIEDDYVPSYVRQHFIKILNGETPLITKDNAAGLLA